MSERAMVHQHGSRQACHRKYNEERPKKSLGGLTPAIYATTTGRRILKPTAIQGRDVGLVPYTLDDQLN